ERTVTNVAAGRVSETSTDAVNGSQLYATNTELGKVGTKVDELDNTVQQFQNGNTVRYVHTNSTGADSTATGADSTAVGAAANAYGDSAVALGNGAVAGDANDAAVANAVALGKAATASGGDSLALGAGAAAAQAGAVALGSGSTTAAAVATTGGTLNGTAYRYAGAAPTSTVSVGSAGHERTVTNVAAGRVSETSTDAVNGSQLYATNTELSKLDGAVKGIQGGDGVKYLRVNSTGSDSVATGTDSVAIGPDAVASNAKDVAIGSGTRTVETTAVSSTTLGGSSYNFAGSAPVGAFSVGAVGAERQIQNVAAGRLSASSTDAVNGSQLYATNQKVQDNSNSLSTLQSSLTTLEQSIGGISGNPSKSGSGSVSPASDGSNGSNGSSASSATNDGLVVVGNDGTSVAVGPTASAKSASTTAMGSNTTASGTNATAVGADAVASGAGSVAVGKGATATESNSVAMGQGSVADRADTVSVGSASNQRQITNVAAGTERTDAVNLGQLQDGLDSVEDWSRAYTDSRVDQVDRRASAGVAAAMAMASLPQAYQPDQSAAGVSLSSFRGEQAIAFGVSTISGSGRYLFKVNASATTRGDAGVAVGAGVVW
uniref:YadA family autotransporter adhesin n=1 Tax=uncultured Xanthomonas sp. TaxID=152831 RepID=UPI0025F8BE68